MTAAVGRLTEQDPRLLVHANAVLDRIWRTLPVETLALVRALTRLYSLNQLNISQGVLRALPNESADLLLESTDAASTDMSLVAGGLTEERLVTLAAEHPEAVPNPAYWFKRVSPATRRAIFLRVGKGWRNADCMPRRSQPWRRLSCRAVGLIDCSAKANRICAVRAS